MVLPVLTMTGALAGGVLTALNHLRINLAWGITRREHCLCFVSTHPSAENEGTWYGVSKHTKCLANLPFERSLKNGGSGSVGELLRSS